MPWDATAPWVADVEAGGALSSPCYLKRTLGEAQLTVQPPVRCRAGDAPAGFPSKAAAPFLDPGEFAPPLRVGRANPNP